MKKILGIASLVLTAMFAVSRQASAAPRKTHSVYLGATKKVTYSKTGDPSGAAPGEDSLPIRALLVDGALKEWTTGDAHEITERSFVVRRAMRINDALPGDKPTPADHWVWQRGPWLLVDRTSGRINALHLPDYNPGASQVSWFRDYAAYCGLTPSGKNLYAVVAQVAVRKPVLARKLAPFNEANQSVPACAAPDWQRDPLRITFHPAGMNAVSYDIVPGSAVLVEDGSDEAPTQGAEK